LIECARRRGLVRLGYRDLDDFDRRAVLPDSVDPRAWQLRHEIPIRFNRCVVFRGGRLFHGITSTFGSSAATARLTQNFFFHERKSTQ